ncbi:hypothetical protein GCM10007424_18450 [Flavobacterium suaedae]|uniref:VCBS repeat-containing protein n=1 Tax=Flavobacterium suaedae TaxID=1767027 RepID=A0ABQ1JV06_9FLAO|nr:hypothetical protein [Flavobacterium suaedae]GGB78610.1 hypothetical protein GCM10007424_18450 [Flavobacterium suaedae]
MRHVFTIFITCFYFSFCFGQNKQLEHFVPKGWKALTIVKGDLNADGLEDAVMVIEEDNPDNIIKNATETPRAKELSLNSRQLLVLFKNESDEVYTLKVQNGVFIPAENSKEFPCLEDPYHNDGVIIEDGKFIINFYYFHNCGNWNVTNETYRFRFQENSLVLKEYDIINYHRASGFATEISVNLVTNKKYIITGNNIYDIDDDTAPVPVKTWSDIQLTEPITLQSLGEANCYYYENWL